MRPHLTLLLGGMLLFWWVDAWSASISGQIIDAKQQVPLHGCEILLLPGPLGSVSDSSGKFIFSGLKPGKYYLQVQFIGYQVWEDSIVLQQAQDDYHLQILLKPQPYAIEEVVVIGNSAAANQEVVGVHWIDSALIWHQPATFGDPQRALAVVPALTPISDLYNEFSVFGGSPEENTFYINNFEIRNPNHFGLQGSGGGIISVISPLIVRKVKLYTGSQPLRYPNALSSVTVYQLRSEFPERFIANMNFTGMEFVIPIKKAQKGFQGFISGRKSWLQWIGHQVGVTTVPEYMDGMLFYHFHISPKLDAQILLLGANDQFQIVNDDPSNEYTRGVPVSRAYFKQVLAGISVRGIIRSKWMFQTTVYRSLNRWQLAMYADSESIPYLENQSRETGNIWQLQLNYYPFRFIEITAGSRVEWFKLNHYLRWNADRLAYNGQINDAMALVRQNRFASRRGYLYSEVHIWTPHRLRLVLGVRGNWSEQLSRWYMSPRVALSIGWQNENWVQFTIQKNYQFPSFLRTTLAYPYHKQLSPAAAHHLQLEWESRFSSNVKLKLNAYWKQYQHLPFLSRFDNPGYQYVCSTKDLLTGTQRGRVVGGSMALEYKVDSLWYGQLSIFAMQSRFYDWRNAYPHPGNFEVPYGGMFIIQRKLQLSGYSWYQQLFQKRWFRWLHWVLPLGEQVTIGLQYRFAAGRPYTLPIYQASQRQWLIPNTLPLNNRRYPDYHRVDVRIEKVMEGSSYTLRVYLNFTNIFNQKNVWDYQYLPDGRKIPVYQFQATPFLGIRMQW